MIGIQAISLQILRRIIPEFDARVVTQGGRILESNGHIKIGSTDVQFEAGSLPDTIFISRLSLERILREYVQSIPTVRTVQGLVTGVTPDITGQRIQRVIIQVKSDSAQTIEVDTSMFADCSGPATIGLKLLEKAQGAGWGPYPKTMYGG